MDKEFVNNLINKWNSKHYFNAEKDRYKQKKLIYNSFTRTNSYEFNSETLYPYLFCDTLNRYYKMKGYNVLYETGVNDLSKSSFNFAKKTNIDYLKLSDSYKSNLDNLGIGYDPNYFINSSNTKLIKEMDNFFNRHFNKEIKLEKIEVYTDSSNTKYYNSYEYNIVQDCAYSKETNELLNKIETNVFTLDISNIEDKIRENIDKLNIDNTYKSTMLESLGDYSNLIVPFYIDKNLYLNIELDNPHLMAGISFIALNPSLMDVKPFIAEEEYDSVYKYMQNGYSLGVFSGNFFKNPLNYSNICIIISYNYNEAIHVGIPQINEYDLEVVQTLGLDYNYCINTNNSTLINSDFLNNLTLNDARKKIIEEYVAEGMGDRVKHFKVKKLIISSIDLTGAPIPLEVKNLEVKYNLLDSSYLPIYYNRFNKIIYSKSIDRNIELINQTFNNLYQTSITKLYIDNKDNYYESNDFVNNISEVVLEEDIIEEILCPIIFHLIDDTNILNKEYIILKNSKPSIEFINKNNNLNINFISESINKYSVDTIRLYTIKNYKNIEYEEIFYKLDQCETFINDLKNSCENFSEQDFELDNKLYNLVNRLNELINVLDITNYTKELEFFFYKEINNKKWTQDQALTYLKLLSIICPFVCEYIFNLKFDNYDILFEEWPTY